MTNIQDVAKAAGVSVATVSRVLNDQSSVAPATREKVQKVIQDLGYERNLLGRNLRRSETKMILVLLQNLSNPFYSKVVQGMEDVGHQNGYNVMVCNTDLDEQREKLYLDLLKSKLVDGVIFTAPTLSGAALSEVAKHYPIVQCSEYKEKAQASRVSIDNVEAGYCATRHLIELGHTKIGMISGKNRLPSAIDREKGYKKALKEAGITFRSEWIQNESYGFQGGFRGTKRLLKSEVKPTAIFAISDIMAIGSMKALKEEDISIPREMAVIGFDNTGISGMYDPALTTIAQPRYELGATAMDLLLQKIRGEEKKIQHKILKHELIIRDSTTRKKLLE
ncbi:MAG: LacI family transcriptional regulator [Epulopiscium sp.]|mgnify:CR=1 FL=1|nr:LacI family transcriptional regulator [Candidatus Epulonipiscium sp.]